MDSTPMSERISELASLDPAEVVEPAEQLADALEAGLGTAPQEDEADAPPA